MKIRVVNEPGSPTLYHVESSSVECVKCGRHVSRSKASAGEVCGHNDCTGKLDVLFYKVDLAEFLPVGRCSCPHFDFRIRKELQSMSPKALLALSFEEQESKRCQHLNAARCVRLNSSLIAFEAERLTKARGQKENQT